MDNVSGPVRVEKGNQQPLMMSDLAFPLEKVNAYCLHKQHLTFPFSSTNVNTVVRDVLGLHATFATTPYLSLWARLPNFSVDQLWTALTEARSLVKAKCMRGTLFILPTDFIGTAIAATRRGFAYRDVIKVYNGIARAVEKRGGDPRPYRLTPAEIDSLRVQITALLRSEVLTAGQIKARLGTGYNISYILYHLCDDAVLVRVPLNVWTSNQQAYTAWESRLPGIALEDDEEMALVHLVHAYLRAFGPVCLEDIVWWTGVSKELISKALSSLEDKVALVNIIGLEQDYVMLASDLAALRAFHHGGEPMVHLLPSLDGYMMGYRQRERQFPSAWYRRLHDRAGNVYPTVLVDGRVVGTWKKRDGKIDLELFTTLDTAIQARVRERAAQLEEWLAAQSSRFQNLALCQ